MPLLPLTPASAGLQICVKTLLALPPLETFSTYLHGWLLDSVSSKLICCNVISSGKPSLTTLSEKHPVTLLEPFP